MKNMKKLLGVMAALGLSTVAAVNVVACGPKTSPSVANDLLKSFQKSYDIPYKDLKSSGVVVGDKGKYNFTFGTEKDGLLNDVITQVIVPKEGATVVKGHIGKQIANNQPLGIPAPKEAGELAAGVTGSDQKGLVPAGDHVTVKVKLVLWKSETKNKKTEWVLQSNPMEINLSVAIKEPTPAKMDLTKLKDKYAVKFDKVSEQTVTKFENKLLDEIKKDSQFTNLTLKDIKITDQKDKELVEADLKKDSLPIKVTSVTSVVTGSKNITVAITQPTPDKIDLKKLKDKYNVKFDKAAEQNVSGFRNKLLTQIKEDKYFSKLKVEDIEITNKATSKDITDHDITVTKLEITVSPANPKQEQVTGSKDIRVIIDGIVGPIY